LKNPKKAYTCYIFYATSFHGSLTLWLILAIGALISVAVYASLSINYKWSQPRSYSFSLNWTPIEQSFIKSSSEKNTKFDCENETKKVKSEIVWSKKNRIKKWEKSLT